MYLRTISLAASLLILGSAWSSTASALSVPGEHDGRLECADDPFEVIPFPACCSYIEPHGDFETIPLTGTGDIVLVYLTHASPLSWVLVHDESGQCIGHDILTMEFPTELGATYHVTVKALDGWWCGDYTLVAEESECPLQGNLCEEDECTCPTPGFTAPAPCAEIRVVDIAFDYEDGLDDGYDIRVNAETDICSINPSVEDNDCSEEEEEEEEEEDCCPDEESEWSVHYSENLPALYLPRPAPLRLKARFERVSGSATTATFGATSSAEVGTLQDQAGFFDENGLTDWLVFESDTERPQEVSKLEVTLQWRVKDIDDQPSEWENLNESKHDIYIGLDEPYPRSSTGQLSMHEPWSEVLEHATAWAAGATDIKGVASGLLTGLSGAGAYPFSGQAQYMTPMSLRPPVWGYNLTDFLAKIGSPELKTNCHDLSLYHAMFSQALGVLANPFYVATTCELIEDTPASDCERQNPLVLNYIDPIGDTTSIATQPTNNPFHWRDEVPGGALESGDSDRSGGFINHSFSVVQSSDSIQEAYDATIRFDGDADPDDGPAAAWTSVDGLPLTVKPHTIQDPDFPFILYEGLLDHDDMPQSDPLTGVTPFVAITN
ncbi:MAG: hypothetical protein AAF533_23265 [Acidobacteriota bacterium]